MQHEERKGKGEEGGLHAAADQQHVDLQGLLVELSGGLFRAEQRRRELEALVELGGAVDHAFLRDATRPALKEIVS